MTRMAAVTIALCLTGFAAATQPMLPRCTSALEGQMSEDGCSCDYDRGGQLTGHTAGWRWRCDLLRGSGPVAPTPPAGLAAPGLPPGFGYGQQNPPGSGSSVTGRSGY